MVSNWHLDYRNYCMGTTVQTLRTTSGTINFSWKRVKNRKLCEKLYPHRDLYIDLKLTFTVWVIQEAIKQPSKLLKESRHRVWRRQWHPTPVLLPGKSHRWRSLVGYTPWGCKESDTTERLHFHFSLSCIGEGNGNPLQCSCLENPRVGGAWWAAVYGVAQSRTRLKWLSGSRHRVH